MGKKRRIYLLMLILGVAGSVGLIVAGAFREREPEYGGKRLSEWVEIRGTFYPWRPWFRTTDADVAICRIGTSAIPFLLDWITYEPPPGWIDDFQLPWIEKKERRALGAVGSLALLASDLGTNALDVAPALVTLLNDPDAHIRDVATNALRKIKPSALENHEPE